jgi:hypothetical protein
MGEEASCNTVSMMEAAAASSNNNKQQQAKENGRSAAAVAVDAVAAADAVAADPRLQGISNAIRVVPHFPKPGPTIHSFLSSSPSRNRFNRQYCALMCLVVVQASCSTTSRRCSSGRQCSRTPWTSSWSATVAWPSTPSPVTTTTATSNLLPTETWLVQRLSMSMDGVRAGCCLARVPPGRGAEF